MSFPKIYKNRAYHIFNRGVSKRTIFKRDVDCKYFIFRIAYYKFKYKIDFEIFCVMPNHFHMLINKGNDPKKVGLFLQRLLQTYARYYNREHNHSGHVFESRYHRTVIGTQSSYKRVFDYIWTNPVKDKLVKHPEEWPYTEFKQQRIFSEKALCPNRML